MGDCASLGEHVLGKDARKLVLADHHLHVDAEVVGRAEHFNDAADGGRVGVGQLVISTSTTRPPSRLRGFRDGQCASVPKTRCGVSGSAAWRNLRAGRNEDGLRHAVVERDDDVALRSRSGRRVAKYADDGGVAALQNTHDAALHAAIGFGRVDFDEHLVALHGAS